ncbi:DUF1800 domain-containing protein [Solitalea koreensis]|uniref:Uncharacterized conserved protein, DUF1800 family n=1 Tax=Solitalea koreensis TaxID=543615 RepID=A0A521C3Z3_9SPHI|nr:DUF1800 domain-containing protein [Solitalea koreensis]SMO54206.1 Uncharacterized conserved protein, DUF1800 family [Solitalea koreensis]
MDQATSRKIQHLYSRAGFGISYSTLAHLSKQSVAKAVKQLFEESDHYHELDLDMDLPAVKGREEMSKEERKDLAKIFRESTRNLNTRWMLMMSTTKAQLREKMTLFWHGHFACRSINPAYNQQLNNILRNNALGNFKDLLIEVAKTPAMLAFLNNQQNKKDQPNENFARELMELFTIGRGNYTEDDVKQAARAFTGWGFRPLTTDFFFRVNQHDFGQKVFMGKTGNFDGTDIIHIILERKETAQFICKKLYKFFVNDQVDTARVNELANFFYSNKYEIGPLMVKMFSSDWFYDDENVGTMIKSPVDFIVSMNRQFYVSYENTNMLMFLQRALGQVLFFPPNVSGWAGGKNWIDSSTLMYRLKIPSVILNNGIIDLPGKIDPDDEAEIAMMKKGPTQLQRKIQATPDWDKFSAELPNKMSKDELIDFILAPNLEKEKKALISDLNGKSLKDIVVQLVSMPEYQLT